MRVHWTNRAKARLRHIKEEIEKDKPLVAKSVIEKILRRSLDLGKHPNVGHRVKGFKQTELMEVMLRPYRIIYIVKSNQIDVISVLHYRQLMENDLKDFKRH